MQTAVAMELRHLNYFVAVAEALSFTRGAQKLHLSQPSLTRQIKDLEQEIGVRLLDRTKGHVSLTREGKSFLNDARRVLALSKEIVESVQRLSRHGSPALNIGYVANLFYDLIPVTLASFQRSFPSVPINLFDMTCGDQLRALQDEKIDLGFVGLHEPLAERDLQFRQIASYETVAALVGRRADNRIVWNLANLRVDFPCTNIFGLALMAGEGEVLLTGRLLRPMYENGQRLFALLAHRRKVIIWHRDQSPFSGGSEFYARRHWATPNPYNIAARAKALREGRPMPELSARFISGTP